MTGYVEGRIQTEPKAPGFLQLGTVDYHYKRKIPIVFQGQSSMS